MTNFASALGSPGSELAQQITKDPYTLDFLAIDSDATERELEERLTGRIVQTLHELGPGIASAIDSGGVTAGVHTGCTIAAITPHGQTVSIASSCGNFTVPSSSAAAIKVGATYALNAGESVVTVLRTR